MTETFFLHVDEHRTERRLTDDEIARGGFPYVTVTLTGKTETTKTRHVFVEYNYPVVVQPRGHGWVLQNVEEGHSVWSRPHLKQEQS